MVRALNSSHNVIFITCHVLIKKAPRMNDVWGRHLPRVQQKVISLFNPTQVFQSYKGKSVFKLNYFIIELKLIYSYDKIVYVLYLFFN